MDLDEPQSENLSSNPIVRRERRQAPLSNLLLFDESDENDPNNGAFHHSEDSIAEWSRQFELRKCRGMKQYRGSQTLGLCPLLTTLSGLIGRNHIVVTKEHMYI